jgi:hypothetical protein
MQEPLAALIDSSSLQNPFSGMYFSSPNSSKDILPPSYRPDTEAYAAAANYLAHIIPDLRVEPLSNDGTTAVVMQDGNAAYKVMREPRHYPEIENEAAVLTLLNEEGITPQLHLLIDSNYSSRALQKERLHKIDSDGLLIPRTTSFGNLAVFVTELKDIGDISELPEENVGAEFNKFAAVALKHQIIYEDCEFHYDQRSGLATIVDVGEVMANPGMSDEFLIHDTFIRFLPTHSRQPSRGQIKDILANTEDLDRLHPLLHEYREENSN